MVGENFDLDGLLKEMEEIPNDENTDFETKTIGDRVTLLDIEYAIGMDNEKLTEQDVKDVKYFILIDEKLNNKLAAHGKITNLDIIIVNPKSKQMFKTTSYKVKLFN